MPPDCVIRRYVYALETAQLAQPHRSQGGRRDPL